MSWKIKHDADDFLDAYKALEKHCNNVSLTTMGPAVVNLAFALELHIKYLHFLTNNKIPRGHNILKLFRQLPKQTKKDIFNHKSISENPFNIRGDLLSPQYYSKKYSQYDRFLDQIKEISDGFEKWRYSYESASLKYDSSFALSLIEAVKSVSNQKNTKLLKQSLDNIEQ